MIERLEEVNQKIKDLESKKLELVEKIFTLEESKLELKEKELEENLKIEEIIESTIFSTKTEEKERRKKLTKEKINPIKQSMRELELEVSKIRLEVEKLNIEIDFLKRQFEILKLLIL